MVLPDSRNTTYAALSQVKSADLNDIQDQIISLNDQRKAPINISVAEGFPEDGVTAPNRDSFGWVESLSTGASYWTCRIPGLREGDVVDKIEVFIREANLAGEEIVVQLFEAVNGSTQQIADTITSGVTGGAVTLTWDDTTNDTAGEIPYTVPTNGFLLLFMELKQTSVAGESRVYNARTTIA